MDHTPSGEQKHSRPRKASHPATASVAVAAAAAAAAAASAAAMCAHTWPTDFALHFRLQHCLSTTVFAGRRKFVSGLRWCVATASSATATTVIHARLCRSGQYLHLRHCRQHACRRIRLQKIASSYFDSFGVTQTALMGLEARAIHEEVHEPEQHVQEQVKSDE
ncbi:hypothetical protein TcWFU_008734 [Taenia crassiceps]|uniref:Secreted protein n=1 Tax=Taenia crassiceps TaxID=6207 RepID=A0ABR4QTR9_9CEST